MQRLQKRGFKKKNYIIQNTEVGALGAQSFSLESFSMKVCKHVIKPRDECV